MAGTIAVKACQVWPKCHAPPRLLRNGRRCRILLYPVCRFGTTPQQKPQKAAGVRLREAGFRARGAIRLAPGGRFMVQRGPSIHDRARGSGMRNRLSLVQLRELAVIAVPVLVVVLAAFWATAQFVAPAVPKTLVIAAASKGSPYYEAAQHYREVLAENGVTLTVRETRGSLENLALINDPASVVAAAFLQGGLASSQTAPDLLSVGRLFDEPVWIFAHSTTRFERLAELAGKRVLIGPEGSATAALATRLLAASGVTKETAELINMELPAYVETLDAGKADAGVLVLAPEARTVKRLLTDANVRLINVVQADAYVQRFPFLRRLELKRGVVDLARDVPSADTQILSTTAALLVRDDLHPALVNLLTQAAVEVHAPPRLNANGESGLFQRAGAFPVADDQEFPLSPDALRVYKSGAPFLQRYLPFWLATSLDRLTVLLLPMIGILLPALKLAPALYTWRIRQRFHYWYRELMKVEADIDDGTTPEELAALLLRIDRIARAVDRLPMPAAFASQLYDLREHVGVVRRRILSLRDGPAAASPGS